MSIGVDSLKFATQTPLAPEVNYQRPASSNTYDMDTSHPWRSDDPAIGNDPKATGNTLETGDGEKIKRRGLAAKHLPTFLGGALSTLAMQPLFQSMMGKRISPPSIQKLLTYALLGGGVASGVDVMRHKIRTLLDRSNTAPHEGTEMPKIGESGSWMNAAFEKAAIDTPFMLNPIHWAMDRIGKGYGIPGMIGKGVLEAGKAAGRGGAALIRSATLTKPPKPVKLGVVLPNINPGQPAFELTKGPGSLGGRGAQVQTGAGGPPMGGVQPPLTMGQAPSAAPPGAATGAAMAGPPPAPVAPRVGAPLKPLQSLPETRARVRSDSVNAAAGRAAMAKATGAGTPAAPATPGAAPTGGRSVWDKLKAVASGTAGLGGGAALGAGLGSVVPGLGTLAGGLLGGIGGAGYGLLKGLGGKAKGIGAAPDKADVKPLEKKDQGGFDMKSMLPLMLMGGGGGGGGISFGGGGSPVMNMLNMYMMNQMMGRMGGMESLTSNIFPAEKKEEKTEEKEAPAEAALAGVPRTPARSLVENPRLPRGAAAARSSIRPRPAAPVTPSGAVDLGDLSSAGGVDAPVEPLDVPTPAITNLLSKKNQKKF